MADRIATVDFDTATYIGNQEDGVYVGVGEGPDGWYVSTVVDCNSSSFCEPMIMDDGPYPTKAEALQAGCNRAADWCIENNVSLDDEGAE